MIIIRELCDYLETFAPIRLAEDWDNVGLLTGDAAGPVQRVMTCLTITPESAAEAIDRKADMIVSHHPLPFRPMSRLTTDMTGPGLIWKLARANIAIYSPHTAFDSAIDGINQSLAERIGLTGIESLLPIPDDPNGLGAGRIGVLKESIPLIQLAEQLKKEFKKSSMAIAGESDLAIQQVAVACGSGGSFLNAANKSNCHVLVTGEATFHTVLEARAVGMGLVLLGHYQSERFAVENLAKTIAREFPDLKVWASERESDPLTVI